jgi:DNA processing protein
MSDGCANDREPIQIENDADLGALIALAGLPNLTPARFWSLVELGAPTEVWARVMAGGAPRHGRGPDAAMRWPGWSTLIDPQVERARHERAGIAVLPFGADGYPDALLDDPDPPPIIFRKGPAELDDRVRVAVVGTRKCTIYGREIAQELGASLAHRGVDVVSGLASGVDAAAHAGAITKDPARLVAVVAGGVDVVYPESNRGLYRAIAEHGALLSEWPLGARPAPWRFPARNRLVAALSAAVVVVESREKGGSMYTVDEALRRDRAVFAVPGSIRSPVSAGTNKLIADGAYALNNIDDLLDAVAPLTGPKSVQAQLGIDSWLLETIGWEPVELDTVVQECGRSPSEVTLEVERLIGHGAVRRLGGVIERVA